MTPIAASRTNTYTGSPLDRMDNLRADAGWIAARLADPDTLFLPTWRGRTPFLGLEPAPTAAPAPRATFLGPRAAEALGFRSQPWALLGMRGTTALFTFDLSDRGDDPAALLPPEHGRFEDLRALAGHVEPQDGAIIAHARGLMHWHTRNRFCGNCGAPTEPRSAGYARECTGCGAQHFPRTDPAVIMLVRSAGSSPETERALLGHSTRFPSSTMYSTLAGFVEPGESLEEAVRREVWEESGVRTAAVAYHSSQPWPFPSSIMLGFYAEALTEEITIDPTELRDARWFTRQDLRDHEALGFSLPRVDSIARRLIEDWIAQA